MLLQYSAETIRRSKLESESHIGLTPKVIALKLFLDRDGVQFFPRITLYGRFTQLP